MSEKTEYELSTHAAMVMAEREIPEEWVAIQILLSEKPMAQMFRETI